MCAEAHFRLGSNAIDNSPCGQIPCQGTRRYLRPALPREGVLVYHHTVSSQHGHELYSRVSTAFTAWPQSSAAAAEQYVVGIAASRMEYAGDTCSQVYADLGLGRDKTFSPAHAYKGRYRTAPPARFGVS